jgi:hypothetical protein
VTEQHSPNPSPPTAAVNTPPSTWDQFGRHRFRAPIGIVIDTPFPIAGGWVAVIWPDPADRSGWRRLLWQHDTDAGRGWLIPERLAYADVIEFGSDPTGARRWYGIVQKYEPGQWLTVQGPFLTPVEAGRAADQLLNPTQHVPEQQVVSHDRARRDRCHNRPQRPRR